VRSLSVRPNVVPQIKALLRQFKITKLKRLAKKALACSDAVEVRTLAQALLEKTVNSRKQRVSG
jgi:phosphoenolpyruvate-protein kinase (PTS system EI component)